jgi:hypothetical protein
LRAIHIPAEGSPALVETDGALGSLQKFVGGYIEAVTLDDQGTTLFLNEEGKTMGLPYNEHASRITRGIVQFFDLIVGDAIVIGCDDEGDSADVPEAWIERFGLL